AQLLGVAPGREQIAEIRLRQAAGVVERHVVVEARIEIDQQVLVRALEKLTLERTEVADRAAKLKHAILEVRKDRRVLEEQPDAKVARVRENLQCSSRRPVLAVPGDESGKAVDPTRAVWQVLLKHRPIQAWPPRQHVRAKAVASHETRVRDAELGRLANG